MSLITAHRILIGAAIVFFLFYAGWETRNYFLDGDAWALPRGGGGLMAAIGFAAYYRTIK
jgi:hypothetical protein